MCGLLQIECPNQKGSISFTFLEYSILDSIARHEMCSFMDGYSDYRHVKMVEEDKDKITFISKWATYAYDIMPFGLCNAHVTFQKIIIKMLKPY
jgi:hypothetical protein